MAGKHGAKEIFLIFYYGWFVLGGMLLAWLAAVIMGSTHNTESTLLAGALAGVIAGGVISAVSQVLAWLLRHRLPPPWNAD